MIKVNNVVKTFDGFRALDGLTMSVPKGAIYGLVGPNGAGKSTIIRHITGIYRPDAGEILVNGQPVYENPEVKKTIAAICGAPSVPGKMGLLKGHKATCYPGMEDTLGCEALTEKVVESGHFITSRGAGTAVDFALALVAKAVSREKAEEIAKGIVYA